MKRLSLIASGLIVAGALIGCGGGGSSGTTNNEYIHASDAYVADLGYITVGDKNITRDEIKDINGEEGKITFKSSVSISDSDIIVIPKNAYVDIDGDGKARMS